MRTEKIEFDEELDRGIATYNEVVGHWWLSQATNSIHRYAYRNIADFIGASFPTPPLRIIDYACGSGNLVARLHHLFPGSHITGLDGSALLLGRARRRLSRLGTRANSRITLIETLLPNFDLPRAIADLVVFVFPNIVASTPGEDGSECERRLSPVDLSAARYLAAQADDYNSGEGEDAEAVYLTLLRDRVISRNIRHLLSPGGLCMRVEYGNVRRQDLPELELLKTGFEEGSLDQEVAGRFSDQWFRVLASRYFRSGVMEDVYHQSRDERDRTGGYFITVMRAI